MNHDIFEFRWIFSVFRRWLWLIIVVAVLAGIATFYFTAKTPPVYKASVNLFIDPSHDIQSGDYNALIAASRLALTYSEMIKGQAILNATINHLDLATTTEQLSNKITVEPIQNTQLIHITVEDESPERSAKIANYLVESFVDFLTTTQTNRYATDISESLKKVQDLDAQISANQSQINKLQIQDLTYTNDLSQLHSSLVKNQDDIRLNEQNSTDIQFSMTQVMDNIKIVQSANAPENQYLAPYNATVLLLVNQGLGGGANNSAPIVDTERLAETYAQILQSDNVLHEVIVKLKLTQSIDAIQKKISVVPIENTQLIRLSVVDSDAHLATDLANSLGEAFVRQMQASLTDPYSSRIENIKSRLADLSAEEETLKAKIEEVSSAKVNVGGEINRLENVVSEDRNSRQTAQDKYEWLRQLASDASQSVSITEPASIPSKPDSNARLYIVLSIILGGMIGLILGFLFEYVDDTIRAVNGLAMELGLPILGRISFISSDDRLAVVANPLSSVSEEFNILAHNIRFAILDQSYKTLVITSSSSSEGKSLVVANLGVTMTRMEQTVVAIDADLRMPTLHKLFGLNQEGGLTDALLGGDIDSCLKECNTEGLRVLPSGKIPTNPVGVIGSSRMHNLLLELRKQVDLVLVDSPPILPIADTSVLASMADGVILVLRINQTRKRAIRDALQRLQQAGAKVIGVVINAIPASSEGYYAYSYQKKENGKFNLGKLINRRQKGGFSLGKLVIGIRNGIRRP